MRGVAVEGDDDRVVIEAFLEAGERDGHWNNWRNRLALEPAKGINGVLKELDDAPEPYEVWVIADRDWRPTDVIAELQGKYPKLLFLPRVMIENYAIDPDELVVLFPAKRLEQIGETNLRQTVESAVGDWLLHGALSQVLHEHGAGDFCTKTEGYPNRLLNPPHAPVTDEADIEAWLRKWHDQLDPEKIMPAYRQRVNDFRNKSASEQYSNCIEGKRFFQEVIVNKIINRGATKRISGKWLEELFKANNVIKCPPDLIPILTTLLD